MDGLHPAPRVRPPNRRPGLLLTIGSAEQPFDVMFGFDPDSETIVEIFFESRGKVGQALDQILVDLGIAISRVLQRPDPPWLRQVIEIAALLEEQGPTFAVQVVVSRNVAGVFVGISITAAHVGLEALLAPIGAEITAILQEIAR